MIYYVLEVIRFQIKKHVSMLTNKMQLVKNMRERTAEPFESAELSSTELGRD